MEKVHTGHQMYVIFALQLLFETLLSLINTWQVTRTICAETCISCHHRVHSIVGLLTRTGIGQQISVKFPDIKFHKTLSSVLKLLYTYTDNEK